MTEANRTEERQVNSDWRQAYARTGRCRWQLLRLAGLFETACGRTTPKPPDSWWLCCPWCGGSLS
jgi:hypothetical protein